MRYTTIIDISEIGDLYRNINCRLLYLHLCLKAGYHDADRDLIDLSIRRLANETGLTVSATRHALSQLQSARLLERLDGRLWRVKKWLPTETISKRKTTKPEEETRKADEARKERQREQEAEKREQLRSEGKTEFIVYFEKKIEDANKGDLEAARIVNQRKAIYIQACEKFGRNPKI